MSEHPRCVVAMEACGGAHYWAREMERVDHEVRLIAPSYVKPFIKRQKNDAADAEAIVEAALRPTMRYIEPKTGEQQGRALVFRTREQFVKQRTEAINALRSHLYEFGYVAPQGIGNLPRLEAVIEDPSSDLPQLALEICHELFEQIAHMTTRINAMKERSTRCPGKARHPPPADHARGGSHQPPPAHHRRDGRDPLALRHGAPQNPWLARMLERKPPMVAAFALANKMARGIWAMLTWSEDYRGPAIGSIA